MQRPTYVSPYTKKALKEASVFFKELKEGEVVDDVLEPTIEFCQDKLTHLLDQGMSRDASEVRALVNVLETIASSFGARSFVEKDGWLRESAYDIWCYLTEQQLGGQYANDILAIFDLDQGRHIGRSIRAVKLPALKIPDEVGGDISWKSLLALEKQYPQHPELLAALAEGHFKKEPKKAFAYLDKMLSAVKSSAKADSSFERKWQILFEEAPLIETIPLLQAYCLQSAANEVAGFFSAHKGKNPEAWAKTLLIKLIKSGSLMAYRVLLNLDRDLAEPLLPALISTVQDKFQAVVTVPARSTIKIEHALLLHRWKSFTTSLSHPYGEAAKQLATLFKSKVIFLYRLAIHIQFANIVSRDGQQLREMIKDIDAMDPMDWADVEKTFHLVESHLAKRLSAKNGRSAETLRFYQHWHTALLQQKNQPTVCSFSPNKARKLAVRAKNFHSFSLEECDAFIKEAKGFPDVNVTSPWQQAELYLGVLQRAAVNPSDEARLLTLLGAKQDAATQYVLGKVKMVRSERSGDSHLLNEAMTNLKLSAAQGFALAEGELASYYRKAKDDWETAKYHLLSFRHIYFGESSVSVSQCYDMNVISDISIKYAALLDSNALILIIARLEMDSTLKRSWPQSYWQDFLKKTTQDEFINLVIRAFPRRPQGKPGHFAEIFASYHGNKDFEFLLIRSILLLVEQGHALPIALFREHPIYNPVMSARYEAVVDAELDAFRQELNQLPTDFWLNPFNEFKVVKIREWIYKITDRQTIHHFYAKSFNAIWLKAYNFKLDKLLSQLKTFQNLPFLLPDIEAKLFDSQTVMQFEKGWYYQLQRCSKEPQLLANKETQGDWWRPGLFNGQAQLKTETKATRRKSF